MAFEIGNIKIVDYAYPLVEEKTATDIKQKLDDLKRLLSRYDIKTEPVSFPDYEPMRHEQYMNLRGKFKEVCSTVRLAFSARFTQFLIETIDYYGIDVSKYELLRNPKIDCVTCDPYFNTKSLNYRGDRMGGPETWGDFQFIILHELRHVMQINFGWLRFTAVGTYWKHSFQDGKANVNLMHQNPRKYNELPQEFDAHMFAINSLLATDSPIYWKEVVDAAKEQAKTKPWTEHYGCD
jgi:hypothetical protein